MSENKKPFVLVPWNCDFLQSVLNVAMQDASLKQGQRGLEHSLFIFPHSRPARYLERMIRQDKRIAKPCLMPQMLPVGKIFQKIWAETQAPAPGIGLLDQAGLLLRCVREEQKEFPGLLGNLPTDNAESFFPWGERLANLFEECFLNNRTPQGFLHLEDELLPFAAAILSRLSGLYSRYLAGLEENGWTTPGFTAQKAVHALQEGYSPRLFSTASHIYLAGFYNPNGAENLLFKTLWAEYGATVLWHADPEVAKGKGHWSCAALALWQKNWNASVTLLQPEDIPQAAPDLNFYAGYDAHSQLAVMREILNTQKQQNTNGESHSCGLADLSAELEYDLEDTAIILPDTSLLMPCLHHIDTADLNISMGYPLTATPLNRFIESILTLHENTRSGGQYWKDCVRLLRQPYIKMLGDLQGKEARASWRELLQRAENTLRQGRRYVNLPKLMLNIVKNEELEKNLEKLEQSCESFRIHFINSVSNVRTLGELAKSLENICTLLLEAGEGLWPRFPIDAECLYRFMQAIIPEMRESALAAEPLPRGTLFSILRSLIAAQRVPFDAYPLTALQVMGLLESRLLSFKTVFVLDATDDLLPGAVHNDPLLPDNLRTELGLPDSTRRQELSAYYFFRLLSGARSVHLFWQEGVEPRGVQDAKKLKSRFIEELLWKQEQKQRRLFVPEQRENPKDNLGHQAPCAAPTPSLPMLRDGPLRQIGSDMYPLLLKRRVINLNQAAETRLKQILSGPLSATRLNSYLRCPASFYYGHITGISPLHTVNEDDDPQALGDLFHNVLRDFYSSHLGVRVNSSQLSRTALTNAFLRTLARDEAIMELPADVTSMLRVSGPRRLSDYLDNQPEETRVAALELPLNAPLSGTGGTVWQLTGQMDRIDLRLIDGKEKFVILDYKTGRINQINLDFWLDSHIWNRLDSGDVNFADQGLFEAVAAEINDVQLPMYLYLASFGRMEREKGMFCDGFNGLDAVHNAGWVALRQEGKELFMLPEALDENTRIDIIENKTEMLLAYIAGHLARTGVFTPRPGNLCNYCDYREICIVL